jgi:beta-glucosidase
VKRLRAFSKIQLDAGEKKIIQLKLPISELAFVGKDLKWIVEPGEFVLQLSGLKQEFNVKD